MEKIDFELDNWKKIIKESLGKTEWMSVLSIKESDLELNQNNFFSALVVNEKVKDIMKDYQWDLRIGNGLPGFSSYYENGKEIIEYQRFTDIGIEPLVYCRNFYNIKEKYFEISEEFRLYFNLFEDRKSYREVTFIYIDENGDEDEVVTISENEVKIKLKFIKEYLAVKKMHLVIYFEFMRFSDKTLKDLGLKETDKVYKDKDYIYSDYIGYNLMDKAKVQHWILGKKIISGDKKFKPNIFKSREKEKYEEFIIGIDEDGNEKYFTCEEDKLANYFGKNPKSPQFITPVYFKRDVLNKYYSNTEKYEVEDGYLSCKGLWGLRMDNNHPKFVMVFLGDLGHLPYKEQIYWKSFNVPSQIGISNTAWQRSFEGKFSDPEQPDLYFKQRYKIFSNKWFKKFKWYLFKPLSEGDIHHFKALHIPITKDQKEFDEQVLSLTKIIIDSLNEKELIKGIELEKSEPKGLDKFEGFLRYHGFEKEKMFEFLRNLQTLRSTSVAHRKSEKKKEYLKVREYFDLDKKSFQEVFEDILIKLIWTFNSLDKFFLKE